MLLHYNTEGQLRWQHVYTHSLYSWTTDIRLAPDGRLYVAGQAEWQFFFSQFKTPPRPRLLAVRSTAVQALADEGTQAVFHLTLTAPATEDVLIGYETVDGTGQAGQDYEATMGTLTIPAGEVEAMIAVPILADKMVEMNRFFYLNLSAPVNTHFRTSQANGKIWRSDIEFVYLPWLPQ